jgi:hypothetical protein
MGYFPSTRLVIAVVDPIRSVIVTLRRLVAAPRSALVGMLQTTGFRYTQRPVVDLDRGDLSWS